MPEDDVRHKEQLHKRVDYDSCYNNDVKHYAIPSTGCGGASGGPPAGAGPVAPIGSCAPMLGSCVGGASAGSALVGPGTAGGFICGCPCGGGGGGGGDTSAGGSGGTSVFGGDGGDGATENITHLPYGGNAGAGGNGGKN